MKPVIATKVTGTVKWFNVKSGYGFISSDDTGEDVFVHQSAIITDKPKKRIRSVGDGESVEFDIVYGDKGNEAANVSGPNGAQVKGSPHAADRKRKRTKKKIKGDKGEIDKTTRKQNKDKAKHSNDESTLEDKLAMLEEIKEKLRKVQEMEKAQGIERPPMNLAQFWMRQHEDHENSSEEEEEDDENVIKFKVGERERVGGCGCMHGPSPYVRLSNVEESVENMLDVDEMVVSEEKKSIKVIFDYPLEKKFVFEFESPIGGGFTRGQLVTAIANKYKDIYKEEQETSTLPEESMSERSERLGGAGCNLINRAETNGKYGIWGHGLGDLDLAEVIFCPEEECYYLSVDS